MDIHHVEPGNGYALEQHQMEMELASEDEIKRLFDDCTLGAIPPLGLIYGVETVLDESLTQPEYPPQLERPSNSSGRIIHCSVQ